MQKSPNFLHIIIYFFMQKALDFLHKKIQNHMQKGDEKDAQIRLFLP